MRISDKYSIQNSRTGEVEIKKIPDDLFQMDFESMIFALREHGAGLGLSVIELLFYLIFVKEGWNVYRLPLNKNSSPYPYIVLAIKDKTGLESVLFHEEGAPDFFLLNFKTSEFKFVEVKLHESRLSDSQMRWIKKYDQVVYIARWVPLINELTPG